MTYLAIAILGFLASTWAGLHRYFKEWGGTIYERPEANWSLAFRESAKLISSTWSERRQLAFVTGKRFIMTRCIFHLLSRAQSSFWSGADPRWCIGSFRKSREQMEGARRAAMRDGAGSTS